MLDDFTEDFCAPTPTPIERMVSLVDNNSILIETISTIREDFASILAGCLANIAVMHEYKLLYESMLPIVDLSLKDRLRNNIDNMNNAVEDGIKSLRQLFIESYKQLLGGY